MDDKINNKKAQVTIFIIIGVLIVVAIILIFTLYREKPEIIPGIQPKEPNQNIAQCVNEQVEKISNLLVENNFYSTPDPILYKEFAYKDEIPFKKYPYLCFTPNTRARCIIQEPVLMTHLEGEVYNLLGSKIEECFSNLKLDLENEGYAVEFDGGTNYSVQMLPGAIKTEVKRKMRVTKSSSERDFEKYGSYVQSPLYDMAIATTEILYQEARYCNSDYVLIMRQSPKIEIDKFQTGDDNKIYTVKDTKTEKLIRFAVRGCVLPTPKQF
ncbi:MAG: hypothetical protein WC796_00455 [Candidatus Pacearchaeota archaeon]|jgi:hypothetical protein